MFAACTPWSAWPTRSSTTPTRVSSRPPGHAPSRSSPPRPLVRAERLLQHDAQPLRAVLHLLERRARLGGEVRVQRQVQHDDGLLPGGLAGGDEQGAQVLGVRGVGGAPDGALDEARPCVGVQIRLSHGLLDDAAPLLERMAVRVGRAHQGHLRQVVDGEGPGQPRQQEPSGQVTGRAHDHERHGRGGPVVVGCRGCSGGAGVLDVGHGSSWTGRANGTGERGGCAGGGREGPGRPRHSPGDVVVGPRRALDWPRLPPG